MDNLFTLVSGGLAGAVATLITQKVSEPLRIWSLSKSITATPEAATGAYRVRVCNHGKRAIEQAIAYISLKFDKQSDIVDGEESAFLNAIVREELNEDRLCWSIASSDPHPYVIDIYQGEGQALDLVRFDTDKIVIPSEQGWDDKIRGHRARVFLRKKRYEGSLHIVAKNTLRRTFDLVIDASPGRQEVTISERKLKHLFRFLLTWRITRDY